MTDDTLKTLFHPFETGMLDLPVPGTRALFLGARPGLPLPGGFAAEITAVQGFRPDLLGLKREGVNAVPEPQGEAYDLALVLAGRHRGQNEAWISEAQKRTKEGGLIVVAASKKDGGESLRKRVAELVGIEDQTAKYHGMVFWLRAGAAEFPQAPAETVGRFTTRPGMFSHGHADPGSSLLLANLPSNLKGDIADFCAGWGFLSADLAERTGVKSVDLYEADHASLQAAKAGLADMRVPMNFYWRDLLTEKAERPYDVVVMNPPFHAGGHAAEPNLGKNMIRAAAAALKGSGRLFLVANRGLPYERELAAIFAQTGELARDGNYKILWAVEPQTRNQARREKEAQEMRRGRSGATGAPRGAGRPK
jgi:16S rRNA (guanine1207-N2)-methyltransferase